MNNNNNGGGEFTIPSWQSAPILWLRCKVNQPKAVLQKLSGELFWLTQGLLLSGGNNNNNNNNAGGGTITNNNNNGK